MRATATTAKQITTNQIFTPFPQKRFFILFTLFSLPATQLISLQFSICVLSIQFAYLWYDKKHTSGNFLLPLVCVCSQSVSFQKLFFCKINCLSGPLLNPSPLYRNILQQHHFIKLRSYIPLWFKFRILMFKMGVFILFL